jgi:hypothetical protein
MTTVICEECSWKGSPDDCGTSSSVYHDLTCPKCGTSNLDTSDLRKEFESQGRKYGYGDHNTLETNKT